MRRKLTPEEKIISADKVRQKSIKWYHNNIEKKKIYDKQYQLNKRFNITTEKYNEMFLKQNGCCAICGKHQKKFKKAFAVDHCHKTGEIRGLLCSNCNRAIGYLYDNILYLNSAIQYLNKYNVGEIYLKRIIERRFMIQELIYN
jgi:hypothetical protein